MGKSDRILTNYENVFVIGDQHFGHENILTFTDHHGLLLRPEFSDVSDMNEYLIETHNQTVDDDSIVYFLGDVFVGPNKDYKILKQLKGRKKLCVGNHDNVKAISPYFDDVRLWYKIVYKGRVISLSHVPQFGDDLDRIDLNIHGHVHTRSLDDAKHFNASAEVLGYIPSKLIDLIGLHFPH